MNQNYQQYLQSDHWQQLRERKEQKATRCAICATTKNLQTHHLFYKNLYDVQTSDLRVLCDRCHKLTHELIKEGILVPNQYSTHHGLFAATKAKVKKRLGCGNKNLFNSAV